MTLLWLLDEAWATIEPHLPKNQPRRPARGRPAGDLRHPVCAQGWLSLVRLPGRLRPVDDGVQPVQPLVAPGLLAEAAERAGRCRRGNEEHRDRQHLREGATRRLWRKKGRSVQAIGRSRGGWTTKVHALATSSAAPMR